MIRARIIGMWALVFAVVVSGCTADAATEKVSLTKGGVGGDAAASSKAGPSEAVRHAQTFTSLHVGAPSSKSVASIALNSTETGSLAPSDPRMEDGSHYDLWEIRIPSSQVIDIHLTSDDFDTYLLFSEGAPGGDGAVLASDDDGGGGTNSRIQKAVDPGTYTIIVNSYDAGDTGSYTLSVSGQQGGAERASPVQGRVNAGETASGRITSSDPTLDDGSHYHSWQHSGNAGDALTVTLRSSDFDAFLLLMFGSNMSTAEFMAEDDDGAGGTDARITFTLPETGVYSIIVNTYDPGEVGSYQLAVESEAVDWARRFPGGGDPNGKYAVVVGLDDYPGTANDLRGPVDDAELVRDVLIDRFGFPRENVVFLQDAEATRAAVANAIVHHLGQAGPQGTAALFFSGHGTQLGENIGLTGPYDAESGNQMDEAFVVYDGIILDDEMGYLLQQLRTDNTLVVIDACFSGTMTRGADAMAKFIPGDQAGDVRVTKSFITTEIGSGLGFGGGIRALEAALASPDRHILMAASTEDQVSWAIGRWPDRQGPASLYTYYWAKVMSVVPANTTFQQAHVMISDSVNAYVGRSQGLSVQTAQLLGPNRNSTIGSILGR